MGEDWLASRTLGVAMITDDERQAAQRIIDVPDISFDGVTVQSVESADAKLVAAALLREAKGTVMV